MRANLVGNTPEPEELYGRDDLVARIWRQIPRNNILLLGPRRFGKSGVMRHLLRLPRDGFVPVHLDLMDADSPEEFVLRLTEAVLSTDRLRAFLATAKGLPKRIGGFLRGTFDAVEFEGAKVHLREELKDSWRTTVRRLGAELERCPDTVLFLLDEFPWLVSNIEERRDASEARAFMAWFSTFRLQGNNVLRRHRFVVGGSIGIDTLLRRLDPPDKLRDFQREHVGAINEVDALRLVADVAPSLDIELPEEVRRVLVARVDNVPYFAHLLLSFLAHLPPSERHPVAPATLERVYRDKMLGVAGKGHFDHYHSRLDKYGKERARGALAILRAVAHSPEGSVGDAALYDTYRKARGRGADQTEYDEVLADLQCDFYLSRDAATNEYRFMVEAMRDWWQRWYGAPAGNARRASGERK